MKVERIQRPLHPGELAEPSHLRKQPSEQDSFANVLKTKLGEAGNQVKFSAHAVERLAARDILLTEHDVAKLNDAVQKIDEKGGKESLMLMGDTAFIVSVKNRTVITAVDSQSAQIFTNIDSALIMK